MLWLMGCCDCMFWLWEKAMLRWLARTMVAKFRVKFRATNSVQTDLNVTDDITNIRSCDFDQVLSLSIKKEYFHQVLAAGFATDTN